MPSANRKVLNVGGNRKEIAIPAHYKGWDHVLLDIDPEGEPDIVCDARNLTSLEPAQVDAVYCSHNLEHYYPHDVPKVLKGFLHVLRDTGFIEIRVPDMRAVMQLVIQRNLDIEDVLYVSSEGPITARDVFYGYGVQIERSGRDFYAHKTGFTQKSLQAAIGKAGFRYLYTQTGKLEVHTFAFRSIPTEEQRKLFGLPPWPAQ